ncbi:MAG: hypothetical protein ACFFEY_13670 [Candidatus Thorarchaeota archaeon]
MNDKEDISYPSYAFIALARRGMEKISLDQCFLNNCDNQDPSLLQPLKKEVIDDEQKLIEKVHIKCKKCNRIFILKFETLKHVAKSTQDEQEKPLSMGLVSALDEDGKNLGHIGYF